MGIVCASFDAVGCLQVGRLSVDIPDLSYKLLVESTGVTIEFSNVEELKDLEWTCRIEIYNNEELTCWIRRDTNPVQLYRDVNNESLVLHIWRTLRNIRLSP